MTLERLLPPANPPVALTELAEFLRLSQGFGDDAIEYPQLDQALTAATSVVERALSRCLVRQRWVWTISEWPKRSRAAFDHATLDLPLAPLLSIDSITRSQDGQTTVLPPERYHVLDRDRARLLFIGGRPSLPLGGSLSITFDVGFGEDWNAVPPDLRQAILQLAGHFFENRLAADVEKLTPLPFGVAALLDPWRPIRI